MRSHKDLQKVSVFNLTFKSLIILSIFFQFKNTMRGRAEGIFRKNRRIKELLLLLSVLLLSLKLNTFFTVETRNDLRSVSMKNSTQSRHARGKRTISKYTSFQP